METEKLYYQDPFLQTFTAKVLTCEPSGSGFLISLDRTAFYPEGGGQPADHGVLAGGRVIDVQEREGVIFHIVENPVEIGENVTGTIDWCRRFDHMQQHSGEHILSGILCREYCCHNVGFHMGAAAVTIDYDRDISWEQAIKVEEKANAVIWADAPVEVTYPSHEELHRMDYRSKRELTGQVRIVTFLDADCCACCGTHVTRAGQVGLVKILSCQKFREGVRMEIVCGGRAFRYLSAVYEQDRAVAQRLSVKPLDTDTAVGRLAAELSAAKTRMAELEETAFDAIAKEHEGVGDTLLFQSPMRPDSVRRLADAVARRCGGLAAVFAGPENGSYRYAMVQAGSMDIAPFVKAMNAALNGRGGGRNGFAQGGVQAKEAEIIAFFRERGF